MQRQDLSYKFIMGDLIFILRWVFLKGDFSLKEFYEYDNVFWINMYNL